MEFEPRKGQSRILPLALLPLDTDNARFPLLSSMTFPVSPVSFPHPLKNQNWWEQMMGQVGNLPVKE